MVLIRVVDKTEEQVRGEGDSNGSDGEEDVEDGDRDVQSKVEVLDVIPQSEKAHKVDEHLHTIQVFLNNLSWLAGLVDKDFMYLVCQALEYFICRGSLWQ